VKTRGAMALQLSVILVVAIASIGTAGAQRGAPASPSTASPYFPGDDSSWARVSATQVGMNLAALDEALTYAGQAKSTGVVILHGGLIAAERYWERTDVPRIASSSNGSPIEDVASLQKSVISILAGVAVDKGLLRREDSISKYLGGGWSRAPVDAEQTITVNHLLSMTSGLTDALEYEAPAGQRWYYNTPAYSQLIRVLAQVTGRDVDAYTAEWLTGPLGMRDTRWVRRPAAAANPYGLATTARDLARVGLLVLRGGVWQGTRIVSESYLRDALGSSQLLNPTYGLLWRVNGQPAGQSREKPIPDFFMIPAAPPDLVTAVGAGNRRVYVVPSLDLVVTRLGTGPPPTEERRFDREFWERLARAMPRHR
jgi:CubicO group peptidase (beta-lactamase class C family)